MIRLSGSHFDQVLARDREAGEVPGIDLAAIDGAAQANSPAGLVVVKIDCTFGVTSRRTPCGQRLTAETLAPDYGGS